MGFSSSDNFVFPFHAYCSYYFYTSLPNKYTYKGLGSKPIKHLLLQILTSGRGVPSAFSCTIRQARSDLVTGWNYLIKQILEARLESYN